MTNLIDLFLLVFACIKSIRSIDYVGIVAAYICVGVYDPRRHDGYNTPISPHIQPLAASIRRRIRPAIPKIKAEDAVEEEEEIRLIYMLVRPSRHAGMGKRQIAHGRMKLLRQLIMAEEFCQPAPLV